MPDHALGKDLFAECLALGKEKHSAKGIFAECLALGKEGHSAKGGLDKRHPWPSLLPSAKHSAKACHVVGLGSARATAFAECHVAGSRQRTPLPSATPGTRQINIFFVFFFQFFLWGLDTVITSQLQNLGQF